MVAVQCFAGSLISPSLCPYRFRRKLFSSIGRISLLGDYILTRAKYPKYNKSFQRKSTDAEYLSTIGGRTASRNLPRSLNWYPTSRLIAIVLDAGRSRSPITRSPFARLLVRLRAKSAARKFIPRCIIIQCARQASLSRPLSLGVSLSSRCASPLNPNLATLFLFPPLADAARHGCQI